MHLVHGAGGPLGGHVLALDVRVGAGLAVRSAGATIVQPGRAPAPARWDFDVGVGPVGSLDWAPATLREVVVLGRHGGVGGRYRGRLDVSVDGSPLSAHTTLLDGADPALCGPGGTAGARAVGTLALIDAPGAPDASGAYAVGTVLTKGAMWAPQRALALG